MENIKVIDLFCGIGGFSKGFEMAGYDIVAGIDFWDVALETFKNNHNSEALLKDLTETDDDFFKKYENKVDVIIAGPHCQGFSMCGQRKTSDKRNRLFEEVVRAVKLIKPKVVVIENVVGLLSMTNTEGQNVKDVIYDNFNQLGYEVKHKILDASEYGVPQKRKRVIFIISKVKGMNFPKPYDYKVTVDDALSNIPDTNEEKYQEPINDYQKLMSSKESIFYNTIKEVSDIENKSDANNDILRNQTNPSVEDYVDYQIESINTTSNEILMLEDLKSKVFSEQYVEFIDIQINRLNSENRTYTAMLENGNIYEQYKNGQIGYSRALSLIEDNNQVISSYANKTSEFKVEADSFLSVHTDMKEKFNELGIDEDFLFDQIEEVKVEYVS